MREFTSAHCVFVPHMLFNFCLDYIMNCLCISIRFYLILFRAFVRFPTGPVEPELSNILTDRKPHTEGELIFIPLRSLTGV